MNNVIVCPFCGVAPKVHKEDENGDVWIECVSGCNIRYPAWHWNTRVPDNQLRAENKRLREALQYAFDWLDNEILIGEMQEVYMRIEDVLADTRHLLGGEDAENS